MPEDASIEDFLAESDDEEADADTGSGSERGDGDATADGDATDPADDATTASADADDESGNRPSNVDPPTPTAVWSRDGECVACGAVVERRWQTDRGPVCSACREW